MEREFLGDGAGLVDVEREGWIAGLNVIDCDGLETGYHYYVNAAAKTPPRRANGPSSLPVTLVRA